MDENERRLNKDMGCVTNKVLPIQEKPSIITCIHYGYPCAVIESKELAIFYVRDFEQNTWNKQTRDTDVQIENERITVMKKETGEDTNTVLWRQFRELDEIILHIEYVKLMDMSRFIDVFLFEEGDLNDELKKEDKSCGVRWNPYGLFIQKNMFQFDTKRYVFVKVCKKQNYMLYFASINGVEWEMFYKEEIRQINKSQNMNIGIHIYSGVDKYDIWKKMNFIQLIYNESDPYKGIWLDYFMFPRKNFDNSYMYFSNFLDTQYEDLYEAIDCFESLQEYIKWNIKHYYYVVLCLDEFYVSERRAYQEKNYPHYNMFYGFDDKLEVFYIMGYGINSTPVVSKIQYKLFEQKLVVGTGIVKYRYRGSEVTGLKFNIKSIITGLNEFLYNIDSSEKFCNLLTGENIGFGISSLKRLATTESGKEHLINDKRVSFCIKEHCKLMGERLDYLHKKKYIKKEEYQVEQKLYSQMNKKSSILLNLVLKNKYKLINNDMIFSVLLDLYETEKLFCKNLIQYITERLSE